jgi:Costars
MANTAQVEHEVGLLVNFIRTIGKENSSIGKFQTTFGDLFRNDDVQNTLESLAGTLKAAKRRKLISYNSELLLQGVHDKEVITLENS